MARHVITLAKVLATCLIVATTITQISYASSIPIWEFLTRNEKMSHLYSTFAQLVSVHCKATAVTSAVPVNQCKHNLLSYGYEKLQTFTNAQLDALDPYQHAANELIWSSIMRDHPSSMLITTRKPLPTPPASSIIILTHQKPVTQETLNGAAAAVTNTAGTSTSTSTTSTAAHPQYEKNPLFGSDAGRKYQHSTDMDVAYGGYPSMATNPQVDVFDGSGAHHTQTQQKTYLTGPLVIRVRPDGSPVEEDKYKPLPSDDDLEVYHMSSLPSESVGNSNGARAAVSGRQLKHRRIATISDLKQQHYAALALQQQKLLPPYEQLRVRRQPIHQQQAFVVKRSYHYGKSQA